MARGTARRAGEMPNEPIAIVGSACRFPGESSSPSKLWDLLRQPRDVLKEMPIERFSVDGYYHPDNMHHGTSNVRHSYLLDEDVRLFDARFFGIKPVEANSIDPQQRLLLETVYEGIEAAGLKMKEMQGSQTAVYVGLMSADYADMLGDDKENMPTYFATGTARSIASNRVSYFFDWHGPSMTIDTACSSSLVAVHQAVQVLRSGDGTDVAVAAGVNLLLSPDQYIAESKLKMLSPDGRSQMWDEKANGYARGDGIACVVMKTLSQAIKDGDRIECLIRDTQINQDGKTKGITMPSATAQTALIRATYKKAGLDLSKPSDRPQFFEAHGTGTPAGDPIEAEAIHTAFFGADLHDRPSGSEPLYVGSIKTVIGHTEGTAGLAALLKASLALQNRTIPPNCLLDALNPKVQPFYGDLQIATRPKPWPELPQGTVRRASVNSFGFGGANAHAILEAYEGSDEEVTEAQDAASHSVYTPLNFSANSETSLRAILRKYAAFLDADESPSLRDLSWTLNNRRSTLALRTSVYGGTAAELAKNLIAKSEQDMGSLVPVPAKSSSSSKKPCVLGVFTGQGAQWARMGAQLIITSPAVSSILDRLEQSLADLPDGPSWSIKAELFAEASTSRINEAAISQPLCTAVQIVLVDLLRSAGIEFAAVVGHSSGEMGAAYAAGYLSASDAIRIAYYRGYHLHLAQGPNGEDGAMMAVGTSFDDAQELCDLPAFTGRMSIAASNSSASLTLSGDKGAVEWAKDVFDDEKKFARLLKVDKAYHSHHMLACSDAYSKSLADCKIQVQKTSRDGTIWISSVYGEDATEYRQHLSNEYWVSNMVSPVLFSNAVEFAVAEKGPFDIAIELGPHPALKGPALQVLQEVATNPPPYTGLLSRGVNDNQALAEGFGYIWQALGDNVVNFSSFDRFIAGSDAGTPKLLPNLPSYAWDHEHIFWHESRQTAAIRTKSDPTHELLGTKCPDGAEQLQRWRNMLRPKEIPWLAGHQIQGQMVFPAAGYISAAFEAVKIATRGYQMRMIEVEDFVIGQAIVFNEESSSIETQFTLTDISFDQKLFTAGFSFYSASSKNSQVMVLNASGKISVVVGDSPADALPSYPGPEFNLLEVDADRFYTSLEKLGFGYTGPFRALENLQRKMGSATGVIRNPQSTDPAYNLLLHPATIDCAIQSIILAYCYPNDGRLWSVHLPTRIKKLRIDPRLCEVTAGREVRLNFKSTITSGRSSEIEGDVDIYDEEGRKTMMQLEGMHTKPLQHATAENDALLFSEAVWAIDGPSRELAASNKPDFHDQSDFSLDVERVAFYYLRHLDDVATSADREKAEWHHKILFEYIDHTVSSVRNRTAQFANRDWLHDTPEQIEHIIRKYPGSIDMRLMRTVGEHLIPVIRGETTMLEYMREDDLLNAFYADALGFREYTDTLAQQVSQLGHRYPHMDILEIGAGTGGATRRIFDRLDKRFGSYTYTDISAGFFENAMKLFEDFVPSMSFKALNIEKDPIEQGFQEHSYDLIVASLVLHATHEMETTMKNVRRLLKPGGYLIMLELSDPEMRFGLIFGSLPGWWMGYDDGRKLSPCMVEQDWDACMRKTGFAGVDAIVPRQPTLPVGLTVITGQAVDERVAFLREPLAPNNLPVVGPHLTIVGGTTARIMEMAEKATAALKPFYKSVIHVKSFAELCSVGLPFMGTALCLTDLDKALFHDLTAEELKGVQQLFKQAKNILWVTQGCRRENPYSNMSVGLGRVLILEMTHLRLQYLNFESASELATDVIMGKLLQLEATELWNQSGGAMNLLWSVESELTFDKGHFLVPRIVLNPARNDRYNSSRRHITKDMDPASSNLSLRWSGAAYEVHEETQAVSSSEFDGTVDVEASYSTLDAIKVTGMDYLYLVLGTNTRSKDQVLALSANRSSIVRVQGQCTLPCNMPVEDALQLMPLVRNYLIALATFADLPSGETLVLLEPEEMLASVVSRIAAEKGIKAMHITTRDDAKGDNWKFIHPNAPRRTIESALPKTAFTFVTCVANDKVATNLTTCLPPNCQVRQPGFFTTKEAKLDPFYSSAFVPSTFRSAFARAHHDAKLFAKATSSIIAAPEISPDNQPPAGSMLFRWTSPARVQITPVDYQPLFSPDKTYWLVGLTSGLGLSLCEWMVKHGAKHIALTSRNPKVDPRWEARMGEHNATIKIYKNDITDRESVAATYRMICAELPPVAGVAQGAMALDDALFDDLSLEQVHRVIRPKVDGCVYLEEIFAETKLEFFVFFSSMASVAGNQGQSMYAAANSYMTALAAQRRHRGLAGSAINIGAIVGNGYVTRELTVAKQEYLTSMGNIFMSEQDFHQIFAEGVVAGRENAPDVPEIMTGLRMARMDDADKVTWFYNPKFSHCVLWPEGGANEAATSKQNVSVKAQLLMATTPEAVVETIQDAFVGKLKSSLQIDASVSIVNMGADELGLDSLVAVDIRSWFIKELNVEMPVLKVLGGFTVAELVADAVEKLPESFIPNIGKEAPKVTPGAQTAEPVSSQEEKISFAKDDNYAAFDEEEDADGSDDEASTVSSGSLVILDHAKASETLPPHPSALKHTDIPANLDFLKPKSQGAASKRMTPVSATPAESMIESKSSSSDTAQTSDSESGSLRRSGISTATSLSIIRDEISKKDDNVLERVVPMSFGQKRFWFLKHYLEDQTAFNITTSIRLEGRLKVEDFARAVKAVGRRHEALRTAFFTDKNNQAMQGVLREPVLALEHRRIHQEDEIAIEYARIKNNSYDIGRGETMKIVLLSLSESLHQLIIAYHHINMDGISLEVLIRDLQQYYYHKKPANETFQYPDYTLIQAKEHASGQWRNELAFWRSEFETIPEPLPILPISNKTVRSPLTKYASHTVKFTIDPAVSSQIQKACSRTKASPFNFYLAAFKALLYRWAGEDCTDICIGMADGGRNNEDVSDSVGFFLNLLPLRFRVQSSQTFNDALKEARSKVVSALANSKVPFDVLLNEINVPRTSTYSPVFQAFINYRQGVQDSRPFCGCQGTATQFDGSQTAYDISIDILDNPGGHSAVYLAGQSALYSESDVELLAQSYHQLIKAFAKNPASRLSRPLLHDPSAAERALDLGRGPTKAYEWPETLIHRIDEMTTLHASKIALKGSKSRLTYSQMTERVNAIASVLELNSMQKGSRIGVFQDPGSDFICCMLAIIRIGAIFVPLEPRLTIARVADIVKDSALDTIVFDKANQGDLNELGSNFRKINVSLVPTKSSTQIPNKANADGTAIILYTSGSTGKPKGILFGNQSWRNQIESTSHAWHVNCDAGVHLQQSAWSFDISISQTFLALANGCSLYIVPKDKRGDSRAISNIVVTEGVTFAQATPSELVSWLESGDSNALQKSRWQFAMSGGEAMTSALIQGFRKLAKGDLKLVNAYGPAETTLAIGSAEVRYATNDSLADPLQLFPNYSVYILAPNRQPVPPGMPGEVYIGGAGVAQGYLNNDALNKERFLSDELAPTEYSENKWTKMHKSGDRGRLSMDGGLILEGRIDGDTQIKLRGIRIDLRDIESTIFKQADGNLKDVAVSVHRSQETEYLVAHAVFSVSFTGEREPFLERLRTSLPLPQYMQPVAIIPLDRLPTNHSGKIDRKVIASLPLLRSKANEPVMEQRHDPETTVKEIWQEVLGEEVLNLHVIGSNSDFFHVGGSSMALVKVQAQINSKFHLDLPLIQLFENSTLAGMTKKIVAASGLPEVATESARGPIPSIPQGSQAPSDVHVSDEIDWEEETALTNDLYDLEISPTPKDVGLPFKTVVLTGATGFLGQAILARMVEDFGIDKIHAIAVRRDRSDLPAIFSNSKIEIHSGDLSSPRLGLSEAKAVEVFGEADAVIHNGADVSFLKTYRTLSKANVGSTRELMKLCLPRRVPVHYISSASVAHLSGKPVFGEESVAPFEPPKDGSDGYTASKWASERFLERMSEKFLVPIWIHRPSSVTGDNAPTLDLMSNLLNFSKKMRKVPKSPAWKGSLDFVGVETVASQILDEVKHDNAPFTGTVRYVYESGDLEIAVQDMQRSLEKETGERFETLNVGEWTRAAKAAGLDALLAEYLIGASEVPIVFPRLLRSAPPPRVAPRPSGRTLRKSASSAILRTVNRWFSSESTFST